jgi:uncharacterized protein YukJ
VASKFFEVNKHYVLDEEKPYSTLYDNLIKSIKEKVDLILPSPVELNYVFLDDNFRHEITDALRQANLNNGFTPVDSKPGGLALDFIRRNLFSIEEMVPLPSNLPGDNDDLNDKLDFFVQQAINDPSAVIYAFGQHWADADKVDRYFPQINPSTGIHDIHMNQGNPAGKYSKDNGIYQDGGLLFHFASRNRWAAVFTAFQSQSFHTNDSTGHPLNDLPITDVKQPEFKTPLRIIAALANPEGDDAGKEYIILLNKGNQSVNLQGWSVADKLKKKDIIGNLEIAKGSTLRIDLNGQGAQLGNKGGNITLLNKEGLKVDGVSYTKEAASDQGVLIDF